MRLHASNPGNREPRPRRNSASPAVTAGLLRRNSSIVVRRAVRLAASAVVRVMAALRRRVGVPYLFYAATKGASPVEAIAEFLAELRASAVPRDVSLVPATPTASWPDAFRVLAAVLPDSPVVVVLDELPWLAEQDETFDGALQTAWDRLLSKRPVLLLLLGSNLHMMERLTAYDRPFFGRADNLLLGPLNPAEVGDSVGLQAADAIDAYLLSGGLPGILRAWPRESRRWSSPQPVITAFRVPVDLDMTTGTALISRPQTVFTIAWLQFATRMPLLVFRCRATVGPRPLQR